MEIAKIFEHSTTKYQIIGSRVFVVTENHKYYPADDMENKDRY